MEREVLEKMLEISRTMAETRELDPLLKYAMGEAIALVNAERGYLVLVDEDGHLDFRVKQDAGGNELANPEDQISMTILARAINNREPEFIVDAMSDPHLVHASSVTALQLRSVMCVPLVSRGEPIGAIYVENRSSAAIFRPSDLTPLTFFGNQAAVLIENAVLNEHLEERVRSRTQELNDALEQLERSWLAAVQANELRTTFLANLTHDMRTPLSVAIGAISMVEDNTFGELNPDQTDWIAKSMTALRHVTQLTDDLFNLTRSEQDDGEEGSMELTFVTEPTDLTPYLDQLFQIGRALPWSDGVSLKLDIKDQLPTLLLDPVRIRQVLFNLLSNALKFTEKGSVTIYAKQVNNQEVLLGVRDTGMGIESDKLERIFQRFEQADDDVRRRRKGAGLGLAISQELVKMHGGTIWVESEIGHGSDFKFTLPIT